MAFFERFDLWNVNDVCVCVCVCSGKFLGRSFPVVFGRYWHRRAPRYPFLNHATVVLNWKPFQNQKKYANYLHCFESVKRNVGLFLVVKVVVSYARGWDPARGNVNFTFSKGGIEILRIPSRDGRETTVSHSCRLDSLYDSINITQAYHQQAYQLWFILNCHYSYFWSAHQFSFWFWKIFIISVSDE